MKNFTSNSGVFHLEEKLVIPRTIFGNRGFSISSTDHFYFSQILTTVNKSEISLTKYNLTTVKKYLVREKRRLEAKPLSDMRSDFAQLYISYLFLGWG